MGDFESAKRRILVVGDSFAASYVSAFDELILKNNYAVTITSTWGASPVPDLPNMGPWAKANDHYWNVEIPRLTDQLKPGDWVFLVSDLTFLSPWTRSEKAANTLRQFAEGLHKLKFNLDQKKIKLAVLHGSSFLREMDCSLNSALKQWFAPNGGPCRYISREITLLRRQPLDKILAASGVKVFDPIDLFCPGDECTIYGESDLILIRDNFSHPSIEAAQAISPQFARFFIENDESLMTKK